jgi:hypothetical protein
MVEWANRYNAGLPVPEKVVGEYYNEYGVPTELIAKPAGFVQTSDLLPLEDEVEDDEVEDEDDEFDPND